MADTRAHRRERLRAVLLAGLLALSVVAGVAGIGAAHDGSDHVERNGDEVEITLGDEHFDGDDRNVTVDADSGADEQLELTDAGDGEFTGEVPVANLSVAETDLSNASVTVETANESQVTEHVDLRTLTFGGGEASVSGNTIRVPLQQALGYADGGAVDATLADDGAPIADASVQYDNDSTALSVELDAAQVDLPPSQGVTLSAANGNGTELNLRSLTRASTKVERQDRTLRVTSLLFADGVDYDLVMTEPATNATFANTVTASDGAVTVEDEALANADELAVSVYRNGSAAFEDVPYERADAAVANASVTDDGSAVDVEGSSVSANETTVWLANSSRYVSASVPVDDGTVNLSSTDYQLNENASYRLVVTGEQVVRAEVTGNETAENSENDSLTFATVANDSVGNTAAGGGGDVFGQDPMVLVGAGIAASLVFGGLAFVVLRSRRGRSAPSGRQDDAAASGRSGPTTHDATLRVEDAATGSTVSAEVRATRQANNAAFQNSSPRGEVTETLTNGRGTLTLARGKWNVEVRSHGASDQTRVNVKGDSRQRFELGPRQVTVTVRDDDGDPLSDVAVTCAPDEGRERNGRTDGRGEVTFDVPLAADEVAVEADHEKYDGDAASASVASGDAAATLTLSPLTGGLDVTATVEGTPVPGLPVAVEPDGEDVEALGASRRTGETDAEGVASFDDLLVGEYEVEVTVPDGGSAFSVGAERARVRDGRVARETLDASFEFGLSRNQRDRISSVRQEVDELVSISGRDVAIQRYYGSVVTDLLETVERLPREGHRFARADADPHAVADALLDAAESSAELVNEAMTTKRNSDLFGACVDMPDHRVEWEGGYDVETLFELLDGDRKNQRQTVLTQLRSVDDRINDERSDLASVSPARELWDRVKSFVNEERGDDPVRGAAVAFAAGGLLDAVDELFDHDQLRDRLERTVF